MQQGGLRMQLQLLESQLGLKNKRNQTVYIVFRSCNETAAVEKKKIQFFVCLLPLFRPISELCHVKPVCVPKQVQHYSCLVFAAGGKKHHFEAQTGSLT